MRTDDDLLRAYGERKDRTALDELFRRHDEVVYRAARRILRNDADARDAVQAAFLNAIEKLDTLKESARFPAWLRRIAVNVALEMKRARARRTPPAGAVFDPPPDARWSREDFELLRRALDDLPDDYRQPILLHYAEGLTYEAISEILACPKGTVGTNIHRGMARLRASVSGAVAAAAATMLCLLDRATGPGDTALALTNKTNGLFC